MRRGKVHFERSLAILIKVHGTVKNPDVATSISAELDFLRMALLVWE